MTNIIRVNFILCNKLFLFEWAGILPFHSYKTHNSHQQAALKSFYISHIHKSIDKHP